jgi:acetolactate synthase-1/2/3 large subunit
MGGSARRHRLQHRRAALGAALANKGKGRTTVAIVGDGDFNMAPGVLWTAAHHRIPILYIVHNNRAYHQEVMMILRMASRRQRVNHKNVYVGTLIDNPAPDYTKIAQGYGLFAERRCSSRATGGFDPARARCGAARRTGAHRRGLGRAVILRDALPLTRRKGSSGEVFGIGKFCD